MPQIMVVDPLSKYPLLSKMTQEDADKFHAFIMMRDYYMLSVGEHDGNRRFFWCGVESCCPGKIIRYIIKNHRCLNYLLNIDFFAYYLFTSEELNTVFKLPRFKPHAVNTFALNRVVSAEYDSLNAAIVVSFEPVPMSSVIRNI